MRPHTPAGGVSPSPKGKFRTPASVVKPAPMHIAPSEYGVEIGAVAPRRPGTELHQEQSQAQVLGDILDRRIQRGPIVVDRESMGNARKSVESSDSLVIHSTMPFSV